MSLSFPVWSGLVSQALVVGYLPPAIASFLAKRTILSDSLHTSTAYQQPKSHDQPLPNIEGPPHIRTPGAILPQLKLIVVFDLVDLV